jgi:hypothetical protein
MRSLSVMVVVAALGALIGGVSKAACPEPALAPSIPDGTTATAAQMKTARGNVQAYINVLQNFQDCLEGELKMQPKTELQQRLRDRGDLAIDQANSLKAQYEEQKRAFDARQPAK